MLYSLYSIEYKHEAFTIVDDFCLFSFLYYSCIGLDWGCSADMYTTNINHEYKNFFLYYLVMYFVLLIFASLLLFLKCAASMLQYEGAAASINFILKLPRFLQLDSSTLLKKITFISFTQFLLIQPGRSIFLYFLIIFMQQ